jgi:hypothetical protein
MEKDPNKLFKAYSKLKAINLILIVLHVIRMNVTSTNITMRLAILRMCLTKNLILFPSLVMKLSLKLQVVAHHRVQGTRVISGQKHNI